MTELGKKLNKLPKARLRFSFDLALRMKLYKVMLSKRLSIEDGFLFAKVLRPVPIALLILISLVVGLPSYAYTSPSVTRDNPLYPVKLAVEKVEIKIASKFPESEAKVYEKLSEKRLEEAKYLSSKPEKKNSHELSLTIEDAVDLSVKAEEKIVSTSTVDSSLKISIAEKGLDDKIMKLEDIASNVGPEANDDVINSVANALELMKERKTNRLDNLGKNRNRTFFPIAEDVISTTSTIATTTNSYVEIQSTTTINKKMDTNKTVLNKVRAKTNTNEAKKQLMQIKNKIGSLEVELKSNATTSKDSEKLINKLNDRAEKIENRLETGNLQGLNGMFQSLDALTNNAKHFLKEDSFDKNSNEKLNKTQNNNTSIDIRSRIKDRIQFRRDTSSTSTNNAATSIIENN